MLLLATIAQPQLEEHQHPNLGRLVQPRHYPRIADTAAAGIPWAADNDAFNGGFDAAAFVAMLDRLEGLPGCRFVAAPDVVGDAVATLELFERWGPEIRKRGLPVALVGQDGLERVPWAACDAFFIGGSTDWKLGQDAARFTAEARAAGKWVHMGRVNGRRRVVYAHSLGCDSVDGSSFARWRHTWLPLALEWVSSPPQLTLG